MVFELFLLLAAFYIAFGTIFALGFVCLGVHKIDSLAQGTGAGFRLIILPGTVLFWPLLVKRLRDRRPDPPVERTAHRVHARGVQ